MTIKTDFVEAAETVFAAFSSMIEAGEYVHKGGTYQAGGTVNAADVTDTVEVIKTELMQEKAASASEADAKSIVYVLLYSNLSSDPGLGDRLVVAGNSYTVIKFEIDPAYAVVTLYVEDA